MRSLQDNVETLVVTMRKMHEMYIEVPSNCAVIAVSFYDLLGTGYFSLKVLSVLSAGCPHYFSLD